MTYNYLREADYIRNSQLCISDTSAAYDVTWYDNGNLEGWDSYSLIHTYGTWNGVLFGTSFGGDPYFSRTTFFPPVEAEDYYTLVIQMKVVIIDQTRNHITGAKVQWLRSGDAVWDSDKEAEFEVDTTDNKWKTYIINLGPEQWWQGDIRNLRIYPFLNSRRGDQFFVRSLAIRGSTFKCTNAACSFFSQYSHPCPGVGEQGSCTAGNVTPVTTDIVEDVNDRLIVNIDDYGDQPMRLSSASGLTRKEVAREIEKQLTRIDVGGYVNATVERSADKLKINSGTLASDSSVVLQYTQLAEDLGFFSGATDISAKTTGEDPASEFEYKATYRLRGVEIFKLVDGNTENTAFYHDPSRHEVEAGRVDWQEKTKGVLSTEVEYEYTIQPIFSGDGYTTIDFTHPFNSDGRVRKIFIMCNVDSTSGGKVKLFRPKADGTLTVVENVTFGVDSGSNVYSQVRDTYVIDVDFRVRRGDLLGFYNVDLYLGDVITTQPDAMFYYFPGEATGSFDPGEVIAYGNLGLNYYARGDNLQDLVLLEIDMGDRVNISSLSFYGEELTEDFEFNVAICDDINWSINLFGGTHTHSVDYALNSDLNYTATHTNVAYGRFLLGDGITHTEDALAGTSYGMSGSTGFYTSGETYCYINGDAEWLNESPGEDFGLPYWTGSEPTDFDNDPIAYTLTFQDNKDIYKTKVYFKDRENFIKFHWAYFLGEYEPIGNTYDNRYNYIPAYTAVEIDETRFDEDTVDSDLKAYLFTNPTDGTWSRGDYNTGSDTYALGGDQEAALASAVVRWNVLSHEFETINTKSIQFYTNNHVSTAIMEMEVYSSVPNDPSLLDDVLVSYSREGDYWVDTAFEDETIDGVEVSSALINDNPQFINLEIRSSSTIEYYEFELRLNEDAVRSGDDKCLDSIHPPTTRRGEVNPAYSFPIWNTYDESVDMQVDIPLDEGDDHLILWSKMGSADELAVPEVGPAGQYYKNPDYPLQNDDYNTAINCPCWGLRNLAAGKEVYYNNDDSSWIYWGTYSSGTSLDIAHPNKRITEFVINPVSATYFKIVPTSDVIFGGISEMYFYFDDTELDYTAWTSSDLTPTTPFTTLAPELTDNDFTTGNYNLTVKPFVVDDFPGNSVDSTKWTVQNPAYLTVSGGELISNVPQNSDAYLRSQTKWYLPQGVGWSITIEFELDNWTSPISGYHQFDFGAIAKNTNEFFSCRREKWSNGTDEIWGVYGSSWPDGSAGGTNTPYPGDVTNLYMKLWKPWDNRISMEYGSAAHPAQWTRNQDGFSDETEGFWAGIHIQSSTTGSPPTCRVQRVYIEYGTEGLIGGSFDTHTAVNNIRIAHGTTFPIFDWSGDPVESDPRFDIYISYDNITYSFWQTITSFVEYYMEFETYVAIDLENQYDLDMIRHYGPGASSFDITDQLLYFNNETSDPNDLEPSGALEEWIYQTGYIGAAYSDIGDPHAYAGTERDGTGLMFGNSQRFRSVGKFDPLPTLPTNMGHIVNFNLELYINWRYGDPTNTEVHLLLYECLFNWNPDESDDKWDPTPGVEIGTTVVGEVVYPDVFTNWPIGWAEIELNEDGIQLLQDWISGSRPNYGWYIMEKHDYVNEDVYPIESRVAWFNETYGTSSLHPRLRVLYRNSDIDTGSADDCRWPIVVVPEGETLRKIGIYPDIGTIDAPGGGYNQEWDDLGTILSDYTAKTNVAFDATVSGSSYFAGLILDFITDGVIPDGDIEKVWGSDDSPTQWLDIYFDNTYTIDEFRFYWGYFSADDEWLITDYSISATVTDDFSSGLSNWTNVNNSVIQSEKLRITSDVGGGNEGRATWHETIDGSDMEAIVDFDIIDGPSVNSWIAYVNFVNANDTSQYVFMARSATVAGNHYYELVYVVDGAGTALSFISTSDTSGKLKLVLHGSDFEGFYWNGSDWTSAGTYTHPNWSDAVSVRLGTDTWDSNPGCVVDFDNFELQTFIIYAAGNTEHFRTHILDNPISASQVRIDITGYDAGTMPVQTESGVVDFEGATVREIEIYEAAANTSISSETYPIVAVNLQTHFQVNDYDLVQFYVDDPTTYWEDDVVRYSSNTFDDPYKIEYSGYGVGLTQAQWISIKNNTATELNDGPDYLDNIRVLSVNKYLIHKFPWWWDSRYSTLSSDYSIEDTGSSLKIEYTGGPTTSGAESIDFIEGTSMGTDTHWSEMDLLSLDLYIPDVTKLDDYGSVIFGDVQGLRYHIWDLSTTVSGFSNGWNYLKLKFKDADTKVTNEGVTTYYTADTADLNNYNDLELKSLKFRFRGKGDPLTLYVDNPRIERNTFNEDVKFDKGLYLSNSEYVTFPLSEFDPHKGALEFWFKPDYNYFGTNTFYEFDSRTIFAYSNVANDLFGFFILKGYGPAIVTGNSDFMRIQYAQSNSDIYFDVGDVVHLGFAWSYDGSAIDSFGTTARLYINGELAGSSYNTWEIKDTKSSRLLLGGAVSQKAASEDPTSIWAAVDNLKVYNYCKTDFSDRNVEGIDSIDVLSPNSFLEISKDGVSFYDRNSAYLPLVYEDVPSGESRTVWVRTNIPENLTGNEKRTADLIIEAIRSF